MTIVKRTVCVMVTLGASLGPASLAEEVPTLLGLGASEDRLYDVSTQTGMANNPRPEWSDESLIGITFSPDGVLYAMSDHQDLGTHPNSLFTIDPATGATQFVGETGLTNIWEGDLDFHPSTGVLYGVQEFTEGTSSLFTVDTTTGAATVIGPVFAGDLSAMAFDASGTLYVLEIHFDWLLTVDPSNARVLRKIPLSTTDLYSAAGMDFDPDTGVLYVADGGLYGTDTLHTLDVATGELTQVGPTGLPGGLAGLEFVPEPGSVVLMVLGTFLALRCRR